MKKMTFFYFILCAITIASCKKELSADNPDQANREIISKVNAWLDKKKPANKITQSENVELLRHNLNYHALQIEQSSDNERILVIPVKEGLKEKKNIDKKAIPNLVLILDNMGNIRKGNIVLYLPASGESVTKVPDNTFYHILNTGKPPCNGKFKYLSVTGKKCYELEYRNKKLTSFINIKDSINFLEASRTSSCVDWYWVTTYYNEDGEQINETWDYIGSTCQGQDCEDPYNAMLCPMDGSSGGSTGNPDEGYEFAVSRPWKWDIATSPNWWAESYESVTGIRNANEPQGGHFTNITHNGSYFVTALPGYTWQELGNTTSIDNPQKVRSFTTGKENKPNGTFTTHSGSWYKYFNELF